MKLFVPVVAVSVAILMGYIAMMDFSENESSRPSDKGLVHQLSEVTVPAASLRGEQGKVRPIHVKKHVGRQVRESAMVQENFSISLVSRVDEDEAEEPRKIFENKWLPQNNVDTIGNSILKETAASMPQCKDHSCKPLGRNGVLLGGIVINSLKVDGIIRSGHHINKTPMLYLK